ncbi:MAG: hypothetical protein HYW08_06755 [candidate division NC10 bacterium]|nr:hypothetical protein [candidate division NC10 bacterium]
MISKENPTNTPVDTPKVEEASGGRCTTRRAARETREQGIAPPSASLEIPIYRPFALVALVVTLGLATPIGAIALYRLFAPAGPVPMIWLRLHAHLQIFGFAGVLIMGVAHHLILRFGHRPIRRPASTPWILALTILGLGGRVAATMAGGATASGLWIASGVAESLAFGVFAAWVTARVRATEPRFTSDWLMVTGAWWFAVALAVETMSLAAAATAGPDPVAVIPGPGLYAMGLYGGVFGWVLGVAMRAVPMFLSGRRVGRLGGAVLTGLNGGVLLMLLAEIWPPASRHAQALHALGDLAVAIAFVVGAVAVGAWQRQPRRALSLLMDRTETRFFRLAFACAGLAVVGLSVGAALTLAGAPPHGLLADATRHLLSVGFLIGMICAMGFRFVPVIEGVRIAVPGARLVAFWALALAVLLRTAEMGADYLHEGFLRAAAVSGFLAWVALLAWGLAVGLTMIRGAALRRSTSSAIETNLQ